MLKNEWNRNKQAVWNSHAIHVARCKSYKSRQEQINTAKLGASRFLLSETDIYLFLGLECLGEMPHLLSIRPRLGDAVRTFLLQ